MKVSDYIARRLYELGARQVFMVTGGGAMHLNDAFGKCPGLAVLHPHHEQAAAIAAEGYARIAGLPAIVNVTTGPGGINALNGVFGAWTDSVPMIVVSGQVRHDTTVAATGLPIRQIGDQEFGSMVECAATMTKYAVSIKRPELVRYCIEKAWHFALHGRSGPVWIDVPMNVQGAWIEDPAALMAYNPDEDPLENHPVPKASVVNLILERLGQAKRPLIYAGGGVRASGAHAAFMKLLEHLRVPVVTGWNAHDLIADDHPLNAGRPGILGDRPGNFAVQNADFLLVLGSRLSIRQVGYNWKSFAPRAFIAMVDIDPLEFFKHTVAIDLPVRAHLPYFIEEMLTHLGDAPLARWAEWIDWNQARRTRYPVVLPHYREQESPVNPYCMIQALFEQFPPDQIVVAGDGTACVTGFQAAVIKSGTRFFHNSGCASMGFDLPATVGAAIAAPGRPVACLTGDGSIQMNLQELQTIVGNNLPVKIFLINNGGYHSIRQTQSNWFGEPLVGVGPQSGLTFPDMEKLAAAFGFPYRAVRAHAEMHDAFAWALGQHRAICEVFVDPAQAFEPKAASRRLEDGTMVSSPLEDLAPFLSREELAQNLIDDPD